MAKGKSKQDFIDAAINVSRLKYVRMYVNGLQRNPKIECRFFYVKMAKMLFAHRASQAPGTRPGKCISMASQHAGPAAATDASRSAAGAADMVVVVVGRCQSSSH